MCVCGVCMCVCVRACVRACCACMCAYVCIFCRFESFATHSSENIHTVIICMKYLIEFCHVPGRAYSNIGLSYESLSDYDQAVTYQLKNLDVATRVNDPAAKTLAYSSLGKCIRLPPSSVPSSLTSFPSFLPIQLRPSSFFSFSLLVFLFGLTFPTTYPSLLPSFTSLFIFLPFV